MQSHPASLWDYDSHPSPQAQQVTRALTSAGALGETVGDVIVTGLWNTSPLGLISR